MVFAAAGELSVTADGGVVGGTCTVTVPDDPETFAVVGENTAVSECGREGASGLVVIDAVPLLTVTVPIGVAPSWNRTMPAAAARRPKPASNCAMLAVVAVDQFAVIFAVST